MENIAIELQNVKKSLKNRIILDNISAGFQRGKIHGIIGRNGSGKTMMFKAIMGLYPLDSGSIFIQGKQVTCADSSNRIGVVFDTPGFLPDFSGFKNLKLLAMLQNTITDDRIKETISIVGLDYKDKRPVKKYSLGMKQRLSIAQAIMENPPILLLDEPMNGLDNQGIQDMRHLFLELNSNGTTILIASHVKEDIHSLCHDVYEMNSGKLSIITPDNSYLGTPFEQTL